MKLENEPQIQIAEFGKFAITKFQEVLPFEDNFSAIGTVEGSCDLQQSGLSGARGPDNRHYFARLEGKRDSIEHIYRSEIFCYVFEL